MAVAQLEQLVLTERYREQTPCPQLSGFQSGNVLIVNA